MLPIRKAITQSPGPHYKAFLGLLDYFLDTVTPIEISFDRKLERVCSLRCCNVARLIVNGNNDLHEIGAAQTDASEYGVMGKSKAVSSEGFVVHYVTKNCHQRRHRHFHRADNVQ